MEQIIIPGTGLTVTTVGLGSSHFGTETDPDTSFRILDAWAEKGGNLIDTAHVYGASRPEEESPSEKTIGDWLGASGKRDQIVLCTKGGHPVMDPVTRSFGTPRVTPEALQHDLDMSLSALQTDYVDLYLPHRDDVNVPVGEILEWLEEQVRLGKVRYYGCSNWTAERMWEAAEYAREHGLRGFVCDQLAAPLGVFLRGFLEHTDMTYLDPDIREFHEKTQTAVMSAMSLNNGYFHKLLSGSPVPDWPGVLYKCPSNERIAEKLRELTAEGIPLNAILYRFIMSWDFPTIALMGFSSVSQLEDVLKDLDAEVPEDALLELRELRGSGAE